MVSTESRTAFAELVLLWHHSQWAGRVSSRCCVPKDRRCHQHPAQAKSLGKPRKPFPRKRWEFQQITQYLDDPPAPVTLHTNLLSLGILSMLTTALPHSTKDVSSPRSSLSSYFVLLLALFHYICWLSFGVFCCLPIRLMFVTNKRGIVQRTTRLRKQCKWKAPRENLNHLCEGCVYAGKEHCYPQGASGIAGNKK